MQLDQDTIVAISTPPGRGGIGIVRLSGPESLAIASSLLDLTKPLTPNNARFTHVLDDTGQILDEAIVTFFQAPNSYTTEDVVEIAAHSAPVLLDHLLRTSIKNGARLAQPGEFTQRAFLSGRLDLTQAEAVNDLIAAQTLHQAKLAAAQLGGSIAKTIAPIKQNLLALIAALEAGVDFAEDDLDLLPESEIVARIQQLHTSLDALAKSFQYGRIVREGIKLAIVGRPNAGKSSLFNRLLQRDRAIVTAQPGTTRDPIAEVFNLAGIPITLIDTAGLREIAITPDTEAERQGIARSRTTMAEADLVLHVVDASTLACSDDGTTTLLPEDIATHRNLHDRPSLLLLNKCDLSQLSPDAYSALRTSAVTGEGLPELKQAILDTLAAQPSTDSALVTNLRQADVLNAAIQALNQAANSAKNKVPHEFLLLDLHQVLEALDALTGVSTTENLLRLIFSTFCIGK
jgi:tRNA modification GTPase